jgi:peptidoglycan-associated lipoprotein
MKTASAALLGLAVLLGACASDSDSAGRGGAGGANDPNAAGQIGRSDLGGPGGRARPGSQEDLVATVGDRIFFATDSWQVAPDQRQVMERQAQWLQQYRQVQVTVEGHADERGTREYNLALGQRRANAARDQLVANGVAAARIQTISYGKDRPAELGSTAEAWARNRRAVTVVRGG